MDACGTTSVSDDTGRETGAPLLLGRTPLLGLILLLRRP